MDSKYNYENMPTVSQMKTQFDLQYLFNHFTATLKQGWNSLSLLQKLVLVGIIVIIIYYIVKLIMQQRRWANIKSNQTEPIFLSNLEWDTGGKKIFIGNENINNTLIKPISSKVLPQNIKNIYTYSFWLFINGDNPFYPGADNSKNGPANLNEPQYMIGINNIFYRGSKFINGKPLNQNPGVWIGPNANKLYIRFSTVNGPNGGEAIEIDGIDINKWINISIVVENNVTNIYLNGKLERSLIFKNSLVDTSNYKLFIGSISSGFPGELAYLQYYNSALSSSRIENIYEYYLKKINAFMNNVNSWKLTHKLAPAIPSNLNCNPDESSILNIESEFDIDKGKIQSKFDTDQSNIVSEYDKFKSNNDIASEYNKLKSKADDLYKKSVTDKNDAINKIESFENGLHHNFTLSKKT